MIFFKKQKRINELQSKIFDLERKLFESEQFERIASEKLKVWVEKHDTLLSKYKLIANGKNDAK